MARAIAAEAGLGVVATFIPEYSRHATPGNLVPLDVDGPRTAVDVGLIRREAEPLTGTTKALADWLREATTT
jgi:DNA-binding transcriptional LysR family regulator